MAITMSDFTYIRRFDQISNEDVHLVGGKNASLGEMVRELSAQGIHVPEGFAILASAYRLYLQHNQLEQKITDILSTLDINDVKRLAKTGATIRGWMIDGKIPDILVKEIGKAYQQLNNSCGDEIAVAVRSSATAEDLPTASFAGQQETYLNVHGIDQLLRTFKLVLASLFTNRAISYRVHQGFDHMSVFLSVGVQRMVRSDLGASGVMFSLDTETGFPDVVMISAAYGLGETVVQGAVNPDEFIVFKTTLSEDRKPILQRHLGEKAIKMIIGKDAVRGKATQTVSVRTEERQRFCIDDEDILQLARYAVLIERHYSAKAGRQQAMAIKACNKKGKYIGICGQAPSDYPEITQWLIEQHIGSIALNPDSVLKMTKIAYDAEQKLTAASA